MSKIKIVIHCADLHIRNYQRQDEYAEQLEKFVNKCSEIAKDYDKEEVRIVIAGDIANSKNNISNEFITLTSFFIRKLEEIATVIIIAGNHDMLVDNSSRTDTLTGLFNTADFKNSKFLDMILGYQSGCIVDNNVVWALYSIFDNFNKPDLDWIERDEDTRVIGLYHGMVLGASLNNGSVINEGLDGDAFEGCDCVMAGHIHKKQEIRKKGTVILYPGSLIQQTFGETVSQHGFAVWNLEDMTYEYIELETDYGMYDIEIDSIDDIENDNERLINF